MEILQQNDLLIKLAGLWYNPHTNNKYLFTPGIHEEMKGEISVIQAGTDIPINFNLTVFVTDAGAGAQVEGVLYGIETEEGPPRKATITFPDGKKIRLIKST
jgi:hypothetical protein